MTGLRFGNPSLGYAQPPLLPCPFCPRDAERSLEIIDTGIDGIWLVSCGTCDATGPEGLSKTQAVVLWNRRAKEQCEWIIKMSSDGQRVAVTSCGQANPIPLGADSILRSNFYCYRCGGLVSITSHGVN